MRNEIRNHRRYFNLGDYYFGYNDMKQEEIEQTLLSRTVKQNRCLHSYLGQLADALNEAGYDFNDGKVIRLPVAFTPENCKEYMFRKVMMAMYPDKTSTTELSTTEMQEVYENLNNFTAEKFGIGLDWPDRFNAGQCDGS